jgi:hypothetical protein
VRMDEFDRDRLALATGGTLTRSGIEDLIET